MKKNSISVPVLEIPQSGPISGKIHIPGSKSLSNRAILIAALARGMSSLTGVLHSVDTHYMREAWKLLGVEFRESEEMLFVHGSEGNLAEYKEPIYIENAGTAARFLTSVLTLGNGDYTLTGNERMKQRPISDLIKALEQLGAKVENLENTDCPPVKIKGSGLPGGNVTIPGNQSSQYVSAIMLAAPYAQKDIVINIEGELVSRTYVEMTMKIMEDFGVRSEWIDRQTILIPANQCYQGQSYNVEGDASSASYFFAMAAVTGGTITLTGIKPDSTQGDLGLLNILEEMGCKVSWNANEVTVQGAKLKAVDVDMNTMSDVAPTLAAIAPFAEGTTRIRNVANMRIKECDRISALATELTKAGVKVTEFEDGLSIEGGCEIKPADFDTYDDHRMAMSLSLVGLKAKGIRINDPGCVSKTFPDFYDYFLPLINK